jgi:hypothetical protein
MFNHEVFRWFVLVFVFYRGRRHSWPPYYIILLLKYGCQAMADVSIKGKGESDKKL